MASALLAAASAPGRGLGLLFFVPVIIAGGVAVIGTALTWDHRQFLRRRRHQL